MNTQGQIDIKTSGKSHIPNPLKLAFCRLQGFLKFPGSFLCNSLLLIASSFNDYSNGLVGLGQSLGMAAAN